MNDLLRCPFCGSRPTTEVSVTKMGGGEDHVDFSVVCQECGTHKTVRLKIVGKAQFLDADKAMQQARDAWNCRKGDQDENSD